MSYRLPDSLPAAREPEVSLFNVARHSRIVVDNGTITRINIPCFYGRRMTRMDMMLWDHHGWPSPGRPDGSDYARFLNLSDIDLESEGYTSAIVVLGYDVTGLFAQASIDYDMVVLSITAICPNANSSDVEVPFSIYALGANDEAGQLRDLVTKGTICIRAGYVSGSSPTPGPIPDTYVISFDSNGGVGTMQSQYVTEGSSVTLRANAFTRSGYAFSYWNTRQDGSGISFLNGQTFYPSSDYLLYAQWASTQPEPGPDPEPEPTEDTSWANASWETITRLLSEHYAGDIDIHDYWSVGDTRTVSLSAMSATGGYESHAAQEVELVLLSANHYQIANSDKAAAFVFGLRDCLDETGITPYESIGRYQWCNSTYMSALPSQLRALLKPVRMNLAITSGILYCWLPAEKEVFGSNTYADAGSETLLHQYTYYATPSNRIKQANGSNVQWYERSLVSGDAATCAVSTYGSPTTEGGTTPCGIAPCGCI